MVFLDWAERNAEPEGTAEFRVGQAVRLEAAPTYIHNGEVAIVRDVRRIDSVAVATRRRGQIGDPFYLIEYSDKSTTEIAESHLKPLGPSER